MKKLVTFLLILWASGALSQRISELPPASSIDSADLAVIVQDGVTKKANWYLLKSDALSDADTNIWIKVGNYLYPVNFLNDSVAIGKAVPGARLDVEGNVRVADTLKLAGLKPLPAGVPYGRFLMQHKGDSNVYYTSLEGLQDSTGWLRTGNYIYPINYEDDSVGIGTDGPTERLHIVGNQRIEGQLIVSEPSVFLSSFQTYGDLLTMGGADLILNGGFQWNMPNYGIQEKTVYYHPLGSFYVGDPRTVTLIGDVTGSAMLGEDLTTSWTHIATENIQLGDNYLGYDGTASEGLSIDGSGNVTVSDDIYIPNMGTNSRFGWVTGWESSDGSVFKLSKDNLIDTVYQGFADDSKIAWEKSGTDVILETSTDHVGIGVTNPSYNVDIVDSTDNARLRAKTTDDASYSMIRAESDVGTKSVNLITHSSSSAATVFGEAAAGKIYLTGAGASPLHIGHSTMGVKFYSDGDLAIELDTDQDATFSGDVTVSKNINIPTTSDANTGVIEQNGSRFIHSYGMDNIFVGENAGNLTLTQIRNTAIGTNSLDALTSGSNNVGVGYNTLTALEAGAYNMAIGSNSLYVGSTGNYNVGIGGVTLARNTGTGNIAFGYNAGLNKQSGDYNVFIGYETGKGTTANSTKAGNVWIGKQVGATLDDVSNTLMVDNCNTTTPLIHGDFNADTLAIHGDLSAYGNIKASGNIYTDQYFSGDGGNEGIQVASDGDVTTSADLTATGNVEAGKNLLMNVESDDVSNPPTDTEIDGVFGTPATVGAGFMGIINDNGDGNNLYFCISDGTNWWIASPAKATNP